MVTECGNGNRMKAVQGLTPRQETEEGTEDQGPHPPVAAVESPWGRRFASVPSCWSSRLLETISIFVFLGNFTAFISGKIKAVIAGEMIPIRA